jgi:hypothetical protein
MAMRVRPARAWYWVAAVIGLAGLAAGAWLFWSALFGPNGQLGVVRHYHRAPIPGTVTMNLEPGGYTVFLEAPGISDDTSPPRADVSVTGPGGTPVPVGTYQGRFTYQAAGHEGIAVATLRATEAGAYQLSADGEPCLHCAVAVGPGEHADSFLAIIAGVLLPLFATLVAGVIVLITAVGRSRSRRRAAPYPGGP